MKDISMVSGFLQCALTLLTFDIFHIASTSETCPSQCSCTSISETKHVAVDCVGKNISIIPTDFPHDTVEIKLNHNPLHAVQLSSFSNLSGLRRLFIRNCLLDDVNGHSEESTQEGMISHGVPMLSILDLMNNELNGIPKDLPSSLAILHLGSNNIDAITGEAIASLHNLKEFFLDNNKISFIDAQCFSNISMENQPAGNEENTKFYLSSIDKLALNSNRITNIASSSFEGMQSLVALTLSKNKLTEISENTFKGLMRLQHLDLSHNKISHIPANAFEGVKFLKYLNLNNNRLQEVPSSLPMLEWLDLSHNRISNVSEDLKQVIFPAEVFNLAHNPLRCDCKLLWLKELFDRREYLVKYIDITPQDFIPSCAAPRKLAGESWDNLADSVFVCEADSDEPTVYEDPLVPKPRNQLERLKIKSGIITDSSIQIFWTHQLPVSYTSMFIQHYIFGLRGTTTKYVEISAVQQEYTLRNLRFETNYVVCVIPKLVETEEGELQPLSLNHCLEVQTKNKVVIIEKVSYLSLASWYILGMLGTVIFIFSCVGLLALAYGMYSSKTDWSAKYAQEEVQVDAPTDSTDEIHPARPAEDSANTSPPSMLGKDKTE